MSQEKDRQVLRISQDFELDVFAYAGPTGDFIVTGSRDSCEAIARMTSRLDELKKALEESVRLQSHYAGLLNMYDNGERREFENAQAWIDRLNE